jgi:hypothetical protein
MTLRPSETQQGRLWLENFLPEERHAAELLVNSLRVISATGFQASMSELLSALRSRLENPVVFYPIRELPKGMLPPQPVPAEDIEQEKLPNGTRIHLLPLDTPFEALPGSEGIVGNVIRQVVGHRPIPAVASSPETLQQLRLTRPRTIILVEDYSGTGARVTQYVDAWMRHPTIRSWYSYGLIRLHVALVTISARALERLEKHPWIHKIHYCEQAADFSTAMWSAEEAAAIKELCIEYA